MRCRLSKRLSEWRVCADLAFSIPERWELQPRQLRSLRFTRRIELQPSSGILIALRAISGKRLEAEERFKRINAAYLALCEHFENPTKRPREAEFVTPIRKEAPPTISFGERDRLLHGA